jgi:sec-independent protein translocase protein TatA
MSIGFWQIAIVVILVVLLFGRGKISSLMGDVAKGIKSFKKGMATDAVDDLEPKNVSENNEDSTNQDSSNQDSSNQDSSNQDSSNQDSSNKE